MDFSLRTFCDDDSIDMSSWVENERELRLWSGSIFSAYPLQPEEIRSNVKKLSNIQNTIFLTAEYKNENAGFIVIRKMPDKQETSSDVRLGCIILAKKFRKKALGQKMIKLSIQLAVRKFNCNKISLSVFDVNKEAIKCYEACGFKRSPAEEKNIIFRFHNEEWKMLEYTYLM